MKGLLKFILRNAFIVAAVIPTLKNVLSDKKLTIRESAIEVFDKAVNFGRMGVNPIIEGAFPGRLLTKNETEALERVFSNTIDYDKVRIHNGFVSDNLLDACNAIGMAVTDCLIIIGNDKYSDDFTLSGDIGLLIHEATHIWQAQNNVFSMSDIIDNVIQQSLGHKDVNDIYCYVLNDKFQNYGMEQQASIIEDFYLLTQGRPPASNVGKGTLRTLEAYKNTLGSFPKTYP